MFYFFFFSFQTFRFEIISLFLSIWDFRFRINQHSSIVKLCSYLFYNSNNESFYFLNFIILPQVFMSHLTFLTYCNSFQLIIFLHNSLLKLNSNNVNYFINLFYFNYYYYYYFKRYIKVYYTQKKVLFSVRYNIYLYVFYF